MAFLNIRPDSNSVWKNSEIKERLSTYRAIIKHEKSPRFKLTSQLISNIKKDDVIGLQALWKEHSRLTSHFKAYISKGSSDQAEMGGGESEKKNFLSYLELKVQIAQKLLEDCVLCAHRCKVNRKNNELGFCKVGAKPILSSSQLHYGEETVLVPSGTIFFCGCNFHCQFCQNYSISQNFNKTHEGREVSTKHLAANADNLAKRNAKNINWVGGDPNPNTAFILDAMQYINADITQIWNSNFYMSEESMDLLFDIIDVWLPDFKFWDDDFAQRMSKIKNYRETVTKNLLRAKNEGSNEIIIRHLVMPTRVEADTLPILKWIADNVPDALVNIMAQYRPVHLIPSTKEFKDLNRGVKSKEMEKAYKYADDLGLLWRPVS